MIKSLLLFPFVLQAVIPSGLPDSVNFLSNPSALAGYQGSQNQVIVRADDQSMPEFDIGYTYVLSFARGRVEGGSFSVDYASFEKYSFPTLDCRNSALPYAFSSIMQANTLYFYENAYVFNVSNGSLNKFGSYTDGDNHTYGVLTHEFTALTTTSGPYVIKYSSVSLFLANLSRAVYPYFDAQSVIGSGMYENGYNQGSRDGYDEGYRVGYQEGLESVDTGQGLIGGLFSAVVSVPLSVLNGLTPLAIWNVPIISIIMSFLFLGLVFWIVRKFI